MNVVKKIMKISEKKLQKMLRTIAGAISDFADGLDENNEEVDVEQLQMALNQEKQENEALKSSNAQLEDSKSKLESQASEIPHLKSKNLELESKLQNESAIVKQFDGIVRTMKVFERLPEKVKNELKNLMGNGSPEDIVSCGLRLSDLKNFWEVARIHAVNGEIDIAKELGKIFGYLIKIFPRTNSSAQKLDIAVECPFDDNTQVHCEGKTRVYISEILVDGLKTRDGIVIKAIVR